MTTTESAGSTAATEHVEILVNNQPTTVPKHTTGAAIKSLAGVPADFQLFRVTGATEHPVGDDERITVHEGERFIASPTLDPS
jgi:Multiubiquitin